MQHSRVLLNVISSNAGLFEIKKFVFLQFCFIPGWEDKFLGFYRIQQMKPMSCFISFSYCHQEVQFSYRLMDHLLDMKCTEC